MKQLDCEILGYSEWEDFRKGCVDEENYVNNLLQEVFIEYII